MSNKSSGNYAENLGKESAKMELQSNDNFMIFYAVLIFTFVTGILAIIGIFDKQTIGEQTILGIIYEGMLFGISYSIWQIWIILRENYNIVYCTDLFPDLKAYYKGRGVVGRFHNLLSAWFEVASVLTVFVLFELLFLMEIGLLKW